MRCSLRQDSFEALERRQRTSTTMWYSVLQLMTSAMLLVVERPSDAAAFADGAGKSSCKDLKPIHPGYEPQETPNPYEIRFLDGVSDYSCGDAVRVRISTATDREEDGFLGFILQARDACDIIQGMFDVETSSDDARVLNCVTDNDTATHSHSDVKQSVDLVWNALQLCSSNDVYFRGAVVRQMSTFWADWNVTLPFRHTSPTTASTEL